MGWASGQRQTELLQGGLARQHWRPSSPEAFFSELRVLHCPTLASLSRLSVKNLVPSLHDLLQFLGLEETKSVLRLSRSILHCWFPE